MTMRRFMFMAACAALVAVAALAAVGEALSRPALGDLGAPPAALHAERIALRTSHGEPVAAWWAPGVRGDGAVLLLHGVRGDRREMVDRALFLERLGYAVLLIDLPGHGESTAAHITFGANESDGVRAALAWLASKAPGEKVGVIGVSLGAASFVLAGATPPPDAVVLESMFPTITEAVADRLRLHLGDWAAPLAPLLLWQMPLRLGVSADQLRPIASLPSLHAPLLIAAGAVDRHTTLAETQRLYDAANAPKELWVIDGAAHVDLHAYDPPAYEAKVSDFLDRYLRRRQGEAAR